MSEAESCVGSPVVDNCTERAHFNGKSENRCEDATTEVVEEHIGSETAEDLPRETSQISNDVDSLGSSSAPGKKQTTVATTHATTSRKAHGNGSSPVKKTASKPSTTSVQTTINKSVTTSLKKSNTPASMPPKSSSTFQQPGRKLSTVPAKPGAVGVTKPAPASSNSKQASTTSASRPSVVSPAGSASSSAPRPRASISDGLKRAPSKSVTPTSKPAGSSKPSSARPSNVASSRPNPSISSIRELGEAERASDDLQLKLKEVRETLSRKEECVVKLQGQISELSTSLDSASADVAAKNALVERLNLEKSSLEAELEQARRNLHQLEVKEEDSISILATLKGELERERTSAMEQAELVTNLRAELERNSSSQDTTEASQTSAQVVDIGSSEYNGILKAKDNLAIDSIGTNDSHAQALQESQKNIADSEVKVAEVDTLHSQLKSLKADKEESASKISELEVAVMESGEKLEKIEEEYRLSMANVKNLEGQLLMATDARQQAIEEAKAKADEISLQLEKTKSSYEAQLEKSSDDRMKVVASLDALKSELVELTGARDDLKSELLTAQETHKQKLDEVQQVYASKEAGLLKEISDVTATLESQESLYNSKVSALKEEHDQLLQEAFERAKLEAATAHTQELQALRASSSTTIDQIKVAQQVSLDEYKSEQTALLNSQVAQSEKTIASLKLDLKATQDDLAKAKSALEHSRAEVENLTQRGDTQGSIMVSTDMSAAKEEVAQLSKELADTKDDLGATKELLSLTKGSLAELSNNHTRGLEEAAKARAEEITKLRSSYDNDVKELAIEKSTLVLKLSDLEGELSTLRATIATESLATTSNDKAVAPPSPGVTKEELQRMHEAHNLRLHDLEAEHQKAIQALKDELDHSNSQIVELQQDIARKTMEIKYLEQDREEDQEQIRRLQEESSLNE